MLCLYANILAELFTIISSKLRYNPLKQVTNCEQPLTLDECKFPISSALICLFMNS